MQCCNPNLSDIASRLLPPHIALVDDTKSAYIAPLLLSVVETFRPNVSTMFPKHLKKGLVLDVDIHA